VGPPLLVEGLSLVTSVTNALSIVLISKGMRDADANSASLTCTSIQALILSGLLVFRLPELDWAAVAYFAISGIFALGIGRLLYFMAVGRLGVSVSSAIIGSNPLISTFLAIIFLGEEVVLATLMGVILVVSGVYLLSGAGDESFRSNAILIPILSATSYALSNVIRKAGLNIQPHPILGAQVGAVAGSLSFFLYLAATGRLSEINASRRGLGYFSASGLLSSLGWIALMMAMERGTVAVVTTIVYSYPLFSLILSWLFLRGQEDLSRNVVLGCIIVVVGVVLVSIF